MARGSKAERLEVNLDLDIRRSLEIADRYDPVIKAELQELYESLNEVDRIILSMVIQGYTTQEIIDYIGISRRGLRERLRLIDIMMKEYIE